jgi:hypothetical protein
MSSYSYDLADRVIQAIHLCQRFPSGGIAHRGPNASQLMVPRI